MFDDRWQMISRDTEDLVGILRGDETWLSTVELPYLGGTFEHPEYYKYESCLFTKDSSVVLSRYKTKAEAMMGHTELAEKYNLK